MNKDTLKKEEEKAKAALLGFATPNPNRDWLAILSLSAFLSVVAVMWSFAAYFIFVPGAPDTAAVVSAQTLDVKKISAVLNQYADRQKQHDKIEASSTTFVDPSL